ncbi:patatin-like phospholipase family protein [Rhodobacteraceae bacterium B1Z28]|uniref:Patatin-like phospholipase family protein n=1 Tax=Ruegeria haliotis TaxID=2747601 RepID=A0ABX2PVY6_9RHOB|nr:patatin-like phospholipase family protein [Ruegeria haliotis]NVO57811.1 patatin-like phospholipase family protein [Ruegeria haliotis]
MAFKLVSCDGGGIRGYLTCLILQSLQDETQFLDKADGFAGTSTGGLIAVALADGRSQGKDLGALIRDLTVLYRDDADRIFRENERTFLDKAVDEFLRKLKLGGGPGITAAQYNSSGLAEIGQALVGDRTLDSLDPELVLAVNTVCLHRSDKVGWSPFTVTNQDLEHENWLDMRAVKLLDVAMASSAAPTYFPPHLITAGGVDYGYFADGGTFANNPVMNGINVAIAAERAGGLDQIEALSIGTGQQPTDISEEMIKNPDDWGLLKWFGITSNATKGALIELLLTTSAENQYWMAHLVLKDRLVRLNPPLPKVVGLATHKPESYDMMDMAFQASKQTEHWEKAVNLLRKW